MRRVVGIVLLVLMLSGCAFHPGEGFLYAVYQSPTRLKEALDDPVRREHLKTQIGLEMSTVSVGITCAALVPVPFNFIACPVVGMLYNFGMYEFVLELWSKELVRQGKPSLTGPYWERGPHTDLGEKFVNP